MGFAQVPGWEKARTRIIPKTAQEDRNIMFMRCRQQITSMGRLPV